MLSLFPLLFLAATAAPAGLVGKVMALRSLRHEFLTFASIVISTSAIAVTPETISVLHLWVGSPNNLTLLVDLALYQSQAMAAATLFAGLGWAVATGVQCVFED